MALVKQRPILNLIADAGQFASSLAVTSLIKMLDLKRASATQFVNRKANASDGQNANNDQNCVHDFNLCAFHALYNAVHALCTLGARKSHPHFGAATC